MEKVQRSGTENEQYVIVSGWGIILCILFRQQRGYLWFVCVYEKGCTRVGTVYRRSVEGGREDVTASLLR